MGELVLKNNSKLESLFENAEKNSNRLHEFFTEFLGNFISADTKRAYEKDINLFFVFLREGNQIINHPSDIKHHHFKVYRDYMIEQKYSSATINRRLVVIRSFMKWAKSVNIISDNPLEALKLPKIKVESPTSAFTDQEVIDMINAPDITTKTGIVHRMILILLFNFGLRRSELVNIKVKDFYKDRNHDILKIKGKGEKDRHIPINNVVKEEIQIYLNSLGFPLDLDDYFIQTRPKGKNTFPADGSTIFKLVNRYAKQLGIQKRLGAHSCRATTISHLLDTQRVPIRDVAIFVGHTNISTTERYDKKRDGLDNSAAYDINYEQKKEKAS